MSMEHWCNDIDRGQSKVLGRNSSQQQFKHHNSHIEWPGTEQGTIRWKACDWPYDLWRDLVCIFHLPYT